MEKILIIDDDPAICSSLSFALLNDFEVITATDPAVGFYYLQNEDIALTILDLYLGQVDGLQVLRKIRQFNPHAVVIVLTAYGSIRSSVEAIKEGAFYYLTKPVDIEELKALVNKGLELYHLQARLEMLNKELKKQYESYGIIGRSRAFDKILTLIEKVKDIDSNVLITGESGTGKELVARAIHYYGRRQKGPFEVINCAAIPENLLESELFGYQKGAFTGANRSYEGKLRAAHGGTIFLDEIGEMSLVLQAKVLRFLQDKTVLPLGSINTYPVDVRILAATNRNLPGAIKQNNFREDLYYRLSVINIELPPLRERKEDIPLLVKHFIAKYSALLGRQVDSITPEALRLLLNYNFPGNIRELENIIERSVALATGREITTDNLPSNLQPLSDPLPMDIPDAIPVFIGETLDQVEKKLILSTLKKTGGRKKEAAILLGITDRTLRNKLKKYRIKEKKRI